MFSIFWLRVIGFVSTLLIFWKFFDSSSFDFLINLLEIFNSSLVFLIFCFNFSTFKFFIPTHFSPKYTQQNFGKNPEQVSWYLESNNLLNQSQYGCRRGRSAIMALAELDARIHRANANGSTLYSLFFDFENAFLRVWRHLILNSLDKFGLRGNLPLLLQSYLTERKFRVRVAGPPSVHKKTESHRVLH